MPRHAHVPGAMRALPTSMSRARDLHHPAPSCCVTCVIWSVLTRHPEVCQARLRVASSSWTASCNGPGALPWISYICLLHPTWMCISVCQWFISHSASVQILVFFGWARAHKGLHFIPKNRARTQPKQYVFLHGNPLSKIAKYMLYYSFSLGIFHV